MKQIIRRLTAVVLAVGFGLACVDSFSAQSTGRDGMPIARVAAPQIDRAREAALRKELARLREALDRYATEHAKGLRPKTYPPSLDALVEEGYLPEIPIDPVTGDSDWQAEEGVCASSGRGRSFGVIGVRSSSSAISSEGTRYNEW